MNQADFEQLVVEAIDGLPPIGKTKMENVAFVVESEVRPVKAHEIGLKRGNVLLGLYEGVNKLNRGVNYSGVLPDKITIFQNPIEKLSNGDLQKLKELVFEVVRHEVGHHLGFDEEGIRKYEAEYKKKDDFV